MAEYRTKEIAAIMEAADAFINTMKGLEPEAKDLHTKYRGAELARRREAISEQLKATQEMLVQVVTGNLDRLEKSVQRKEANYLNPAKLSDDWALLKLPVQLTEAQCKALAERNADDELFLQGLTQAAHRWGYELFTAESDLEKRRNAVAEIRAAFSGYTKAYNDPYEQAQEMQWEIVAMLDAIEAADDVLSR